MQLNRPHPFILGIFVVSVLLMVWLYFFNGWQSLRALVELQQLTAYSDFEISGLVVDGTGEPMTDVRVKVITSRLKKIGTTSDTSSEYVKINGSFHFTKDNYSSVYLHFLRSGYEVEKLGFDKGGTYSNLRVVMRREGDIATQPSVPSPPPTPTPAASTSATAP